MHSVVEVCLLLSLLCVAHVRVCGWGFFSRDGMGWDGGWVGGWVGDFQYGMVCMSCGLVAVLDNGEWGSGCDRAGFFDFFFLLGDLDFC